MHFTLFWSFISRFCANRTCDGDDDRMFILCDFFTPENCSYYRAFDLIYFELQSFGRTQASFVYTNLYIDHSNREMHEKAITKMMKIYFVLDLQCVKCFGMRNATTNCWSTRASQVCACFRITWPTSLPRDCVLHHSTTTLTSWATYWKMIAAMIRSPISRQPIVCIDRIVLFVSLIHGSVC